MTEGQETDGKPGQTGMTEEGRERSQAALEANRKPPGEANLSHQAYRFRDRSLAPACDSCIMAERCSEYESGGTCRLAEEGQAALLKAVQAEVDLTPAMMPMAREYVKWCTLAQIIDTYISETSPFLPGADSGYIEQQPVMKLRSRAGNKVMKLAAQLGLTPQAKKKLEGTDRDPAASGILKAFRELEEEEAADGEEAVDAEFEAEDDSDTDTESK